jgi:hypothetical protein
MVKQIYPRPVGVSGISAGLQAVCIEILVVIFLGMFKIIPRGTIKYTTKSFISLNVGIIIKR